MLDQKSYGESARGERRCAFTHVQEAVCRTFSIPSAYPLMKTSALRLMSSKI